jgi:tetratricopeptide (TPR) repeat protein
VRTKSLAFGAALAFVIAVPAIAQMKAPMVGAQPEVTTADGRAFYSLPDTKGAVAAAEKALAADPRNPDLILKLAQAQASVWQYREAVATCGRGLRIAPMNPALYLERGHRELALMMFNEAESDLDHAAELDPTVLDVYYHLGLAHYFKGEFAQAADAFQHAVNGAKKPEDLINSTNWLYASLRRANKTDEAAKALAKITPEVTTQDAHSQFYLHLVRVFQGQMKEGDALPPEPPRDGSNTEAELRFDTVAYGIGNWHLYSGDATKAQEYFNRVLQGSVWVTWGFVGSEVGITRVK